MEMRSNIQGIRWSAPPLTDSQLSLHVWNIIYELTRSLRETGGPCTKAMEVSESRMERVKKVCFQQGLKLVKGVGVMKYALVVCSKG